MKIFFAKTRSPVLTAVVILVALVALAFALTLGLFLLATLAIAGVLLGGGLYLRHKVRGITNRISGRSEPHPLDPQMEVRQDPRRLSRAETAEATELNPPE